MRNIVKVPFAIFIIIIIALIYFELESTNPKAFFNKHILSDCQEYLDQYLDSETIKVKYMTWNKHAEHELESKFWVFTHDAENEVYFWVYVDKKNKPVKTDYYGYLLGESVQLEFNNKAQEIFNEEITSHLNEDCYTMDISQIDKAPIYFSIERSYTEEDEEKIEELLNHLSLTKYNIKTVDFKYTDKTIHRFTK